MNLSKKSAKKKSYIKNSILIVFAFATALFPRLLDTAGAPSAVNFLHFLVVPFVSGFILINARTKDRQQLATAKELIFGLFLYFIITISSALLNGAGLINAVLSYLMLTENFMLLLAIIFIPMTPDSFKSFRLWIIYFIFFHLFLIYGQYAAGFCHLPGDCDNVQGVLYRSGSGHVVGASISCLFGVYYFIRMKTEPLWKRVIITTLGFGNIQTSDAKQVVVTLAGAFAILTFTKKDISKSILYLLGLALFSAAFTWAIFNIEALEAFATWIRPELYGPDGEATMLKFAGIRIAMEHFSSPLNWLLGLGPGHSVDRLGGWMLQDYADLLNPLGATQSPVGRKVWQYAGASWLGRDGSSLFSPFWGWAAIWGNIGFLGVGSYLYLCSIVWRRICVDDLSRWMMLDVAIHGFIFTQMEEPAYMLFVAVLIGLRWQEDHVKRQYGAHALSKTGTKNLNIKSS